MHNHNLSRAEDRAARRGGGVVSALPLLAGLLLAAALAPGRLQAQTTRPKAQPPSNRWLFIVETSRSMHRREEATLEAVQALLKSGCNGQLKPGDTLGIWTFNQNLYAGRFPLQTWSVQGQPVIASRALAFLKEQKYEKKASFDKVLPALGGVVKDSQGLTVILISSGDEKMSGTPFNDRINEFYQKWHDQQQKARMPFVTVLRDKNGQLADYTVSTPPWPVQIPQLPQDAQTMQGKLLDTLHKPPSSTVPPLIISGRKTQAEKAPAPMPKPPMAAVEAPAPAPAAIKTNLSVAAPPPKPAASPTEIAMAEPAPVASAQPPAVVAPKPSPAPVPITETKGAIVKELEAKPVASAPALPPPVAAPPAPKLPPAPETSPVAPSKTEPDSGLALTEASPHSPAAVPPPPGQTATAVHAETLAGHRGIWIAGLVLLAVAVGFVFLRLRRSRAAAGASLITQSFERKSKP